MRTFWLAVLAAVTMLDALAIILSTDANAATTRSSQRRTQAPPIVRQDDPYNSPIGATGRRDVNPISGTPRWNAGGAPG
jgi:hypothetical protein